MILEGTQRLVLLSILLIGSVFECAKAQTREVDLGEIYEDALLKYNVFPALDPDPSLWWEADETSNMTIRPIEAVVAVIVRSIDNISPGTSEFTATTATTIYWTKDDCNQTMAHQMACDKRLNQGNGLRFVRAENAVAGALEVTSELFYPNTHKMLFEQMGRSDIQPDAEVIVGSNTYKNSFDVRDFPYEVHALDLTLSSFYSSNVVRISSFPNYDSGIIAPRVPAGWTYLGIDCGTFMDDSSRTISELNADDDGKGGGGVHFYTYQCTIFVARRNAGWWMSSFLLFCAMLVIAYAGSAGLISHMVAEQRDDRDGARHALFESTRLIGTFTIGLLLVYVFQVSMSPYERPIEFWPNTPASTKIYMLGLITIVLQSMSGLIGALVFSHPFHSDGFVGGLWGPYDLDKCPIEGTAGEDHSPLLLKKRLEQEQTDGDTSEEEEGTTKGGGEEVILEPMAPTRRINMKTYNVLSVDEAILINTYVRNIFVLKTMLLVVTFCAATGILVQARNHSNDLMEVALEATGNIMVRM